MRIPIHCDCCGKEKMAELDLDTGKLVIRRIRRNESHLTAIDIDKLNKQLENKHVATKDF